MNWWSGSKQDSIRQASERSSRAARRTIANLTSPTEESFFDADESLNATGPLNLDGNDSVSEAGSEDAPVIMTTFQDENGVDDTDYYKKLSSLKNRNFNKHEVEFYFTSLEASLKHIGVKNQWSKREVLHSLLPDDVQTQVIHILKKGQDTAGTHPYRTLKKELLKIFAPKPEAAFQKAMSRRLTDTPSALAKQIVNDLCTCDEPISSSCCQRTVWGIWSAQLPESVLHSLAGKPFTAATYSTNCTVNIQFDLILV